MTLKEAILELIDSDEFYDILPGNGEDDYICQYLREHIEEIFKQNLVITPKKAMDAIVAAKKGEVR